MNSELMLSVFLRRRQGLSRLTAEGRQSELGFRVRSSQRLNCFPLLPHTEFAHLHPLKLPPGNWSVLWPRKEIVFIEKKNVFLKFHEKFSNHSSL